MTAHRKDHREALGLRIQGKTYGEIRNTLGTPKSTQSYWFKALKLPREARSILAKKQGNGMAALRLCNAERTQRIKNENESIRKTFEAEIGPLSKRDLMLIGASLYWAEGYKNFNTARANYPYVGFSNSDPQMVRIFIAFLEQVLNIEKDRLRAEIHIYPNQSSLEALNYWQEVTTIPEKNIKAYRPAVSRASGGKRPKHLLPHGTLYLKLNSRQEFFKVKGFIDGLVKTVLV